MWKCTAGRCEMQKPRNRSRKGIHAYGQRQEIGPQAKPSRLAECTRSPWHRATTSCRGIHSRVRVFPSAMEEPAASRPPRDSRGVRAEHASIAITGFGSEVSCVSRPAGATESSPGRKSPVFRASTKAKLRRGPGAAALLHVACGTGLPQRALPPGRNPPCPGGASQAFTAGGWGSSTDVHLGQPSHATTRTTEAVAPAAIRRPRGPLS